MTRVLVVTAVEAEAEAVRAGIGDLAAVDGPARADGPASGGTGGAAARSGPGDPMNGGAGRPVSRGAGDPVSRSEGGPANGVGSVSVAAVGFGSAAAAAGTARLLTLAEAAGTPYEIVVSAGIGGGFVGRAPIGAITLAAGGFAADLGAESPDGFLPVDQLGFGTAFYPVDEGVLRRLHAALPAAVVGTVINVNTVTGTGLSAATLATRFPDAVVEGMEGYGVSCAAAVAGVRFAELRSVSNAVGPRDRAAWRIGEALRALTQAFTAAAPALTSPH